MRHPHFPVERLRHAGIAVARLLAVCACATTLAGCYSVREPVTPADFDYRLRHNIAITEGPRTVELFIGTSRGGLNGEQRADVLAFANNWRREATGGIIIDLPSGTRNAVAAANAVHEVRCWCWNRSLKPTFHRNSTPTAAGIRCRRAAVGRECAPVPAARSRQASDAQIALSHTRRTGGSLRSLA